MYRNHLVRKDFSGTTPSDPEMGMNGQAGGRAGWSFVAIRSSGAAKNPVFISLFDPVFSLERSGKRCILELASLSRRSQNVEK